VFELHGGYNSGELRFTMRTVAEDDVTEHLIKYFKIVLVALSMIEQAE
jgi:hypothetical protein